MFWRPISQIPHGWNLCDGSHGTPDLRNQFVVCAGDTYAVGDNGGAVKHRHAFTGDGHVHGVSQVIRPEGIRSAADYANTDSAQAVGTTDNDDVLLPYHAVVFIQKERYKCP